MTSMQWTDEESRYVRAIFKWQDRLKGDRDSIAWSRAAAAQTSAGEFRVLLIGPKGVGKTALLTRFCDASFRGEDAAPDLRFERGGRRTLLIDGKIYTMDVLVMPSHIWPEKYKDSDYGDCDEKKKKKKPEKEKEKDDTFVPTSPAAMMLEQALAITEAAIIVYDITDDVSFQRARHLYAYLLQRKQNMSADPASEPSPGRKQHKTGCSILRFCSQKQKQQHLLRKQLVSTAVAQNYRRSYALLLVGNKSDADDGERCVTWADGSRAAAILKEVVVTAKATTTLPSAVGTTHQRKVLSKPPPWAAKMVTATAMMATTCFPQTPLSQAAAPFLEASAKTGDNVSAMFVRIGWEILQQRKQFGTPDTVAATEHTAQLEPPSQPADCCFGVFRALGNVFTRQTLVDDTAIAV